LLAQLTGRGSATGRGRHPGRQDEGADSGAAKRGPGRAAGSARRKRTLSPEGRARIAAAQRARWAKVNRASAGATEQGSNRHAGPGKRKRTISAEGRARIAAAQRARWAKLRAGKKK
jgi:hypothetical protein